MIVNMRSNDVWVGMPNDVFCNTMIQILMCKLLNLNLGWYQHQVGDLHAYEKHFDLIDTIVPDQVQSYSTPMSRAPIHWSDIQRLVEFEQQWRTNSGGALTTLSDYLLSFIQENLR